MKKLLSILAVIALSGCAHVEFAKRDMKITSPIFNYESHTEGAKVEKTLPPSIAPQP